MVPGASGIVNDGGMWTSLNGHNRRYGVFGHGQAGTAYCCLDRSNMLSCFLELQCNYVLGLSSGMKDRYVAPGTPGTLNSHCRVVAIWLPRSIENLLTFSPPPPSSSPTPRPVPVNPSKGDVIKTAWAYAGLEHNPDGSAWETGYLSAGRDTNIEILSETYPGHTGNIFPEYVYAKVLSADAACGWFPVALLGPSGTGAWALVHSLCSLHGQMINGQMLPIAAWKEDKLLLQKQCGAQILVKRQKCHVFGATQIAGIGMRKKLMLRGHPDKNGDRHLFDLAMILAS